MRTPDCFAVLLILLVAATAACAAEEPRVRVEIVGAQPVLVGQAVRVNVTVLVPNFFLSSPQFPAFDIPGAIVTLLDENALNSSETIDGETYAGITRAYTITSQQAGEFALPPVQIPFRYAAEPGKPAVEGAVTLPPQTFTARLPEGAQASAAPALVAKIVVTQSLDGNPKTMKPGDALTRTVDIFAANTHAMMIPPSKFDAPPGVGVYLRDPSVTDVTTDRGVFTGGRRIDRATYVFKKPGTYSLPAIDVDWVDASGKQQVSLAPEIAVSVSAPPTAAPQSEIAPAAPELTAATEPRLRGAWLRALAGLFGLSLAALAASWLHSQFGSRARTWLQMRRQAWQVAEPAVFARLRRACINGDASTAYRELGAWTRCQGFATLRTAGERQPALGLEINALERKLYGSASAELWNGQELLRCIGATRKQHSNARRRGQHPAMLPELNP